MKLSIIMPVYNAERYIESAVESVIAQSFQDWELIMVDDGSTDASGNIADTFAEREPRIKVIHQKNAGAPYARIRGVMASTGEYIGFMDDDDFLHPQMYEIMLSIQNRYHAGIVCCAHTIGNEYNEIIANTYTLPPYTADSVNVEKWEIEDCYRKILSPDRTYIPIKALWNMIYPTELAKKYFPENNAEDFVYNVRILNHVESFYFISEPLYFYQTRQKSLSHSGFSQWTVDVLINYTEIEEYIYIIRNTLKYMPLQ